MRFQIPLVNIVYSNVDMKHFWLLFVLLLHHKNVQSNDLVHRNFKGTELELDNHPCKAENLKVCLKLLYI